MTSPKNISLSPADITSVSHFDVLRSLTQMAAISLGNLLAHLSIQALKGGQSNQIFEIDSPLFQDIPLFTVLVVSVFHMVTKPQKDRLQVNLFFRSSVQADSE